MRVASDGTVSVTGTVGGARVSSAAFANPHWDIQISSGGMLTPIILPSALFNRKPTTPCISDDGVLFIPQHSSFISAYDFDGSPRPRLACREACPPLQIYASAAAFDTESRRLIIGGTTSTTPFDRSAHLASLEISSVAALSGITNSDTGRPESAPLRTRWQLQGVRGRSMNSIAVLSALRLVLTCTTDRLLAYDADTGARLASAPASQPHGIVSAEDGRAFVAENTGVGAFHVVEWAVRRSGDDVDLRSRGAIAALGAQFSRRVLAVVRCLRPEATKARAATSADASGRTEAGSLVVGSEGSPHLLAAPLADVSAVSTYALPDAVRVVGLTGDPNGTALVVCDGNTGTVHVLSWPLPHHYP